MTKQPMVAIRKVIASRKKNGSTDENIIKYLNHLKTVWRTPYFQDALEVEIRKIDRRKYK